MLRRSARNLPIAFALVLLASACSDDDGPGEPQLEVTTSEGASSSTDELPDEVPIGEVRLTEVGAVDAPTALAAEPSTNELYVAGQEGRIHRLDRTTGETEEVLDISADVTAGGEQGLLGLTFDPEAEHLYVNYTNGNGDTRVDEYSWSDGAVDSDSRRELLAQDQPFRNHNGGDIHFGPDGYLYIGLGDGGAVGDPSGTGQDPDDLLGSLLRIDPAAPSGDGAYAVPADNPFADGGGRPEVWLFGVRNPWRFSFDLDTGDLWIGDVVQSAVEEIDHLPAVEGVDAGRGANLGWASMEGSSTFGGDEPADHVGPVHDYGRDGGNCSVTGGYVYRGSSLPGLDGRYLYGDFCVGELRTLRLDAAGQATDESLGLSVGANTLSSFGQDIDGEVYVLSIDDGKVYRLEPG